MLNFEQVQEQSHELGSTIRDLLMHLCAYAVMVVLGNLVAYFVLLPSVCKYIFLKQCKRVGILSCAPSCYFIWQVPFDLQKKKDFRFYTGSLEQQKQNGYIIFRCRLVLQCSIFHPFSDCLGAVQSYISSFLRSSLKDYEVQILVL